MITARVIASFKRKIFKKPYKLTNPKISGKWSKSKNYQCKTVSLIDRFKPTEIGENTVY